MHRLLPPVRSEGCGLIGEMRDPIRPAAVVSDPIALHTKSRETRPVSRFISLMVIPISSRCS